MQVSELVAHVVELKGSGLKTVFFDRTRPFEFA